MCGAWINLLLSPSLPCTFPLRPPPFGHTTGAKNLDLLRFRRTRPASACFFFFFFFFFFVPPLPTTGRPDLISPRREGGKLSSRPIAWSNCFLVLGFLAWSRHSEAMSSVLNSGDGSWVIEYRGQDDARAGDLLWPSQLVDDPESASLMDKVSLSYSEENYADISCSKKRSRAESRAEPGTKACREKMRRDRLNDRFYELSSLLDPAKALKTDKVAILVEATRRLNQLRDEARNLKESNEALEKEIKAVKAEKLELRDAKMSLKSQKERMEQILKSTSLPTSFMTHPAVAAAPYHQAAFSAYNKNSTCPNYPPVTMWQWLPPAAVDTSQDHVLRPPVA